MSYRLGLGLGAALVDPQYPAGCPSGYTVQAVPLAGSGPPLIACANAAGQTVGQAVSSQCASTPSMLLEGWGPPIAAGALALFVLPGAWKILGLGVFAAVAVMNAGGGRPVLNAQGQMTFDPLGNPVCQFVRGVSL